MPESALGLAHGFGVRLQALEATRGKMECLLLSGDIDRSDIEQVYCGLYLDLFAAFEGLLETLFFGLVSGDVATASTDVIPRLPPGYGSVVRDVLLIGKNYLQWLPYHHTVERATVLFEEGKPFTLLNDQHRSNLTRFFYVRNAIAHRSPHSIRQFECHVVGSSSLTPRERTPAGFLRSRFRRDPNLTQYEVAAQELMTMARVLCS